MIEQVCVEYGVFNQYPVSRSSESDSSFYTYLPHDGELKLVRKDQLWFWTDEWLEGEQEVDRLIRAGDYETYDMIPWRIS